MGLYRTLLIGITLSAALQALPGWAVAEEARQPQRPRALPDLFTFTDGTTVSSQLDWRRRRTELAAVLQQYEYGHLPPRPAHVTVAAQQTRSRPDLGADEELLTLHIGGPSPLAMRIALYRPRATAAARRLPVILREEHALGHTEEVAEIIRRGYLFVEYAREDLAPDNAEDRGPARAAYPDCDWATLAIWAWGGMRVVDYLETRPDVNTQCIGIVGHSRGGKMALLAGALDERFALVVANGSGCGGAGCFRFGNDRAETLELITRPERFGYWFHPRLRDFVGREEDLPLDQHFVKALVAPRALLCTEAADDAWGNPDGSLATSRAAQSAFDLLAASQRNGYHLRPGQHDLTADDWRAILDFADWHLQNRQPNSIDRFRVVPADGSDH